MALVVMSSEAWLWAIVAFICLYAAIAAWKGRHARLKEELAEQRLVDELILLGSKYPYDADEIKNSRYKELRRLGYAKKAVAYLWRKQMRGKGFSTEERLFMEEYRRRKSAA